MTCKHILWVSGFVLLSANAQVQPIYLRCPDMVEKPIEVVRITDKIEYLQPTGEYTTACRHSWTTIDFDTQSKRSVSCKVTPLEISQTTHATDTPLSGVQWSEKLHGIPYARVITRIDRTSGEWTVRSTPAAAWPADTIKPDRRGTCEKIKEPVLPARKF